MGLLDMNFPMLYGEEKEGFYCLQLEVICTSRVESQHGNLAAWQYPSR